MIMVIGHVSAMSLLYAVNRIRKSGAFLLLLLYFFTAAGSGELLKLPILAAHFFEHTGAGYGNDFITYLAGHYLEESGEDADAGDDERLPFRSVATTGVHQMVSLTPPAFIDCPALSPKYLPLPATAHIASRYQYLYLQTIWQPPRKV